MKLYFKVTWRNGAVSVAAATTQVILGDTQGSAVAAPPGVNGSPQSDPELNWFRSKTCENSPVWTCKCPLEVHEAHKSKWRPASERGLADANVSIMDLRGNIVQMQEEPVKM